MPDNRIDSVETKIAYLEDTLQTLNDIVSSQQRDIEELRVSCKYLVDRQKGLAEMIDGDADPDERPPHF
ncbi:MAG: SlyX family protein [Gammaproteobacteria bacterium]|nr:SlyX family protein [Gammaproteobacteria bacterium]MCZ6763140.1 SlyX family protein [Gammaproteobacteria bacterium]